MDIRTWFEHEIVPCVRADGGWLELKAVVDGVAEVTAKGECSHCAALERCLKWIQGRAENELGLMIRLSATREPFLWRK